MTLDTIINREAGDKAKGPRLQRLRCVLLILEAIEKSEKPHIYAAVEHKDDVYIKDIAAQTDYLEQDKNYDIDSNFTFNSHEVINTLVGFCDMWVQYIVQSKEVYLGFYATNNITKEGTSSAIKSLNLELPDKPILELLQAHDYSCPKLLPAVKALILHEYKNQYDGKKEEGYLKSLEGFSDEDWLKFLKIIDWKFGQSSEEETQKLVLEKIKKCKYFSHENLGQEETILRNLLDLLDEKQCVEDLLGKFINTSDVQLLFMKAANFSVVSKADDPVFKIWNTIPLPTDKRNIMDKINAVCQNFENSKMKSYARKTAVSRIMQDDKSSDKSFLSLRYRIYEKCEDELATYLTSALPEKVLSQEDIDQLFSHLYTTAKTYVSTLSTDFHYSFKSETVIEGIVLELFDSCYLALN